MKNVVEPRYSRNQLRVSHWKWQEIRNIQGIFIHQKWFFQHGCLGQSNGLIDCRFCKNQSSASPITSRFSDLCLDQSLNRFWNYYCYYLLHRRSNPNKAVSKEYRVKYAAFSCFSLLLKRWIKIRKIKFKKSWKLNLSLKEEKREVIC